MQHEHMLTLTEDNFRIREIPNLILGPSQNETLFCFPQSINETNGGANKKGQD